MSNEQIPESDRDEHSEYGAGETGGGKPADGIQRDAVQGDKPDGVKLDHDGEVPDEDPQMSVAMDNG